MKPRRIQKARLQDPKVVGNGHISSSKSLVKPGETYTSVHKSFKGKVFYLDLPSNKRTETLETDIKKLGGIIEKFFSKEIRYLVSNKKEARYVQNLRQDSPVPSPDSGHSSPYPPHPQPGSHRDSTRGSSQGPAETVVTSRGKSLVERVVREQKRIQINKILSNALEWGVKILYVDDIIAYIEKKKRNVSTQHSATAAVAKKTAKPDVGRQTFQQYKAGRINKPFVKVEDSSRHYRPIYLALPNMPEFNLMSAPPCSPFYVEDQDHGKKPRDHRTRGAQASASEERGHVRPRKNKKRGGYCECCIRKYDNIKTHLQSEHHRTFAKSNEYFAVDKLVSKLPYNFISIKSHNKRPMCSISSMLRAPGLCMKVEEVEAGKVKMRATERGLASPWSTTVDAPLGHDDEDRRGCEELPGKTKPKNRSLPLKQPCWLGSLGPPTPPQPTPPQETRPAPTPGPEAVPETVSVSLSTHDPEIIPLLKHGNKERKTDMDRHRPRTPDGGVEDVPCSVPFGSLSLPTCQPCVVISPLRDDEDLVAQESVPGPVLEVTAGRTPLEAVEMGVSEQKDSRPPPRSSSPNGKLHRRVRDFKRKRRKVDDETATLEHGKPMEVHGSSHLNIWQLFESSDEMDLDFLGFLE